MNKPILELQGVKTIVNKGTSSETTILKGLNLKINEGDFITIVGTNGAGKSTLFNVIGGNLHADEGKILHNGQDITNTTEEQRTAFLSRVFQDPKLGTAARMTVAENMLLATKRGERRHLIPRKLKSNMDRFTKLAATMNNGLENRMNTATGALSGGQRQALSFLMATIKRPGIIYRIILLAVLQLGFSANDLNLISSVVLAICMMLPQLEERIHLKKPILKGVRPHE